MSGKFGPCGPSVCRRIGDIDGFEESPNPLPVGRLAVAPIAFAALCGAAYADPPSEPDQEQAHPAAKPEAEEAKPAKPAEQKPHEAAPHAEPAHPTSGASSGGTAAMRPEKPAEAQHEPARHEDTHPAAATTAAPHAADNKPRPNYHITRTATTTIKEHFTKQITTVNRSSRTTIVVNQAVAARGRDPGRARAAGISRRAAARAGGYTVGYLDGYVFVYDPASFVVIDVVDLLTI